ncbi:hypothetical protein HJC23_006298, partial [Cyclotella cryptica]
PGAQKGGERILCPMDPSHLIFEAALSKHMLVCPAATHQQYVASQEFYSQNFSRGGFGSLKTLDYEKTTEPIEHLKKIDPSFIKEQWENSESTTQYETKSTQSPDDDKCRAKSSEYHKAAGRLSDKQIASILGHLHDNGLLTNEGAICNENNIELDDGKASA